MFVYGLDPGDVLLGYPMSSVPARMYATLKLVYGGLKKLKRELSQTLPLLISETVQIEYRPYAP